MIFPPHCKCVGYADQKPVGERVYFLSRYLIHEIPEGYEILEVDLADEPGMMRSVTDLRRIAGPDEICVYPERVLLHNRGDLLRRAAESGKRCTIFTGIDEHMIFICDPDPASLLRVHVYDLTPPRPNLAESIRALDSVGIFGELGLEFAYHIRDIRVIGADVYPCRAAGFNRTIDSSALSGGEQVAGCLTGRQILAECYGETFPYVDICPADAVSAEPFIARCCRAERAGIQQIAGKFGVVVHWGSSPKIITDAVYEMVQAWRGR